MLAATLLYSLLFASLGWTISAEDTHLERRDVPPDLLQWLSLFSEYAAAATCEANFNSSGSRVVCDPNVCPMLERLNTTVITGFTNLNPGNTTGFVALDNTNGLIVLSFRGSRTQGNWNTDFDYAQVPIYDICPGCQVHEGYYYAWGNFSQNTDIMPSVNQLAAHYPDYNVVFTGHSLGAALATLGAVFEQTIADRPINLFTFGCPQLGNHSFAQIITHQTADRGYRVTHTDDPVPRVFSQDPTINQTWQYSTTSPEFWITSGNGVEVTPSDIKVIWGIDNTSGNLGTTGWNDTDAHIWYIGNISGCATN